MARKSKEQPAAPVPPPPEPIAPAPPPDAAPAETSAFSEMPGLNDKVDFGHVEVTIPAGHYETGADLQAAVEHAAVPAAAEAVLGDPQEPPDDSDRYFEGEEDLDDLPEALQMAILAFGLKRDHVLDHRLTEDGVVLVTRGGRKLTWPQDEGRELTPAEKGDDVASAPRFWPRGFLEKGLPKKGR